MSSKRRTTAVATRRDPVASLQKDAMSAPVTNERETPPSYAMKDDFAQRQGGMDKYLSSSSNTTGCSASKLKSLRENGASETTDSKNMDQTTLECDRVASSDGNLEFKTTGYQRIVSRTFTPVQSSLAANSQHQIPRSANNSAILQQNRMVPEEENSRANKSPLYPSRKSTGNTSLTFVTPEHSSTQNAFPLTPGDSRTRSKTSKQIGKQRDGKIFPKKLFRPASGCTSETPETSMTRPHYMLMNGLPPTPQSFGKPETSQQDGATRVEKNPPPIFQLSDVSLRSSSSSMSKPFASARGSEEKPADISTESHQNDSPSPTRYRHDSNHSLPESQTLRSQYGNIPSSHFECMMQHLPGSQIANEVEGVVKTVHEFSAFEPFQDEDMNEVVITRKQFDDLKKRVGDTVASTGAKTSATAWDILQDPIATSDLPSLNSKKNGTYTNTFVDMNDLRKWKHFPDYEEIRGFIEDRPSLKVSFFETSLDSAKEKIWYEKLYNDPFNFPENEEISLFVNYKLFFSKLSALLRLACQGHPSSGITGENKEGNWVSIGGGKCAMKRRSQGNPDRKNPDLTSFWIKSNEHDSERTEVDCLIVGDIKLGQKFRHNMLRPDGKGKYKYNARHVVNQIHDYMDMHHNKYGYVLTNKELIMFRRRQDGKKKWGQLDYSPSIKISGKKGELNAMMVLWYFHVRYAVVEDEGWKLDSSYDHYPYGITGKTGEKHIQVVEDAEEEEEEEEEGEEEGEEEEEEEEEEEDKNEEEPVKGEGTVWWSTTIRCGNYTRSDFISLVFRLVLSYIVQYLLLSVGGQEEKPRHVQRLCAIG